MEKYVSQKFTVVEEGGRDVVRCRDVAVIVPLFVESFDDMASDVELLLIENERFVVGGTLLEFPAGRAEPEETMLGAAHRELVEETGYAALRMQPIGVVWSSPGFLAERLHFFLAWQLRLGPGGKQRLTPTEKIAVRRMPSEQLWLKVLAQEVQDAKILVGMVLLSAHLTRLQDT